VVVTKKCPRRANMETPASSRNLLGVVRVAIVLACVGAGSSASPAFAATLEAEKGLRGAGHYGSALRFHPDERDTRTLPSAEQPSRTGHGIEVAADTGTGWGVATPIDPPGAFNKTSPTDNTVGVSTSPTISWGASAGATSYEYCYYPSFGGACSTWTTTGTTTGANLGGLSANTVYAWQVRALNADGMTYADGGSYWLFATGYLPAAFGKYSPADGATSALSGALIWFPSTRATSYEYCYDATNDGACSGAWTSNGNSAIATLNDLSENTTYYWQVRSRNAVGTMDANGGAWWSFTTGTLPGAFAKSTPPDGATGQSINLKLTWGPSTGANFQQYCYDTSNDGACSGTWTVPNTPGEATLSALLPDTTYYWHVRASNAAGATYSDGSSTAYWSFTTRIASPGAFGKSTPANGVSGLSMSPTLTWGASTGATSYEYCYDTSDDNACGATWTSVAGTSADLTGLVVDTTYYWQVRARSSLGTAEADAGAAWWSLTTRARLTQPFTDDPLLARVTPVRAVHLTELRQRIDALRSSHGLLAYVWTDSSLVAGVTPVRSVHVMELRAALAAVYVAASRPVPVYTDSAIGADITVITVAQIAELRAAVAAIE
jgi:hypothetical protein